MLTHQFDAFTKFATDLADLSRTILVQAAVQDRRPDHKSDFSPVTETDRTVERTLRERIVDFFPDHGILGEEYGPDGLDREFVWVIDPIDGTKAFVGGFAVYGTLISLTRAGKPILGIIDNPVTQERWIGAEGQRTTLNGKQISTRQTKSLSESILTNGNPESFSQDQLQGFQSLRDAVQWCVYGGSCMAYGRVADGSLDISIDAGLDAFDFCALVPVVQGAGGSISDWDGNPLTLHSGNLCLATGNSELHQKSLEKLAAHSF
ncbi:inositol monophosphatase family protein [Ochrobactrum soli]|uniref:Inositol monophosphatase family protein n=1 Tax=Ochrobactrum soli TaxID=2448455 RepID=A0A849KXM5_9HYPH|nr:inositol monophosphatase family protein [[Ochrobactrum] soli]NNU63458.1 inositol monophosphatase family protein [[Ochrobactrum] soli]